MPVMQAAETRTDRRKRRNRQALIEAGYAVMAQKGIDAATMSEIADLADVGAGTVYNYFASKDELAMSVMEQVMDRLAQRIEAVTNSFSDPAQVYAFGIRIVMEAATTDLRWRSLLRRSEVIADAMYRVHGAVCDPGRPQRGRRRALSCRGCRARLATGNPCHRRLQPCGVRQKYSARKDRRGGCESAWYGRPEPGRSLGDCQAAVSRSSRRVSFQAASPSPMVPTVQQKSPKSHQNP